MAVTASSAHIVPIHPGRAGLLPAIIAILRHATKGVRLAPRGGGRCPPYSTFPRLPICRAPRVPSLDASDSPPFSRNPLPSLHQMKHAYRPATACEADPARGRRRLPSPPARRPGTKHTCSPCAPACHLGNPTDIKGAISVYIAKVLRAFFVALCQAQVPYLATAVRKRAFDQDRKVLPHSDRHLSPVAGEVLRIQVLK